MPITSKDCFVFIAVVVALPSGVSRLTSKVHFCFGKCYVVKSLFSGHQWSLQAISRGQISYRTREFEGSHPAG